MHGVLVLASTNSSTFSYEVCVSPDSPDFNPCVNHYAPISQSGPLASDQGSNEDDNNEDESDDGVDKNDHENYHDGDEKVLRECIQEERYPFPAGVVCDHENYK